MSGDGAGVARLIGSRWRHVRRGSTYTVLSVAKLQTAHPNEWLMDHTTMIVYVSEMDGSAWARSLVEFTDGRFERIDT